MLQVLPIFVTCIGPVAIQMVTGSIPIVPVFPSCHLPLSARKQRRQCAAQLRANDRDDAPAAVGSASAVADAQESASQPPQQPPQQTPREPIDWTRRRWNHPGLSHLPPPLHIVLQDVSDPEEPPPRRHSASRAISEPSPRETGRRRGFWPRLSPQSFGIADSAWASPIFVLLWLIILQRSQRRRTERPIAVRLRVTQFHRSGDVDLSVPLQKRLRRNSVTWMTARRPGVICLVYRAVVMKIARIGW